MCVLIGDLVTDQLMRSLRQKSRPSRVLFSIEPRSSTSGLKVLRLIILRLGTHTQYHQPQYTLNAQSQSTQPEYLVFYIVAFWHNDPT